MQQTLYDFLFLGQIPGTTIFLSFYEILLIFIIAIGLFGIHRYHFQWQLRLRQLVRIKSEELVLRLRFFLLRLRLNH